MIFTDTNVKCEIDKLFRKGAYIFIVILALWLGLANNQQQDITPLVAGVQSNSDPYHPTEIYYGRAGLFDLGDMAEDLDIEIYPEDKTNVLPDPSLGIGSQIKIERALPVEVIDANKPTIYRTWEQTVGDLLKENKLELLGQDSVDPSVTTWLRPNMSIKITRVAEVEVTEKEAVDYKVVKQYDSSLEKGYTEVDTKGVNGEKEVVYTIKRVDGVEVSKTEKSRTVTKEPQNEIIIIGTKVISYGTGTATWYGRNATMVAASNTIPRGTDVRVVSLASGKSVVVTIDDSGIQSDAIIDLSDDAFEALAPLGAGVISVRVEKYYP